MAQSRSPRERTGAINAKLFAHRLPEHMRPQRFIDQPVVSKHVVGSWKHGPDVNLAGKVPTSVNIHSLVHGDFTLQGLGPLVTVAVLKVRPPRTQVRTAARLQP